MSNGKPTCGTQATPIDDTLTTILAVLGVLGTIGSIIGSVKWALGAKEAVFLGASGGMLAAAAVGAGVTLITIAVFYDRRCSDREGPDECYAGVVNEIEESFSDPGEWLFPFTAMHDRVDVVVKSRYWGLVQTNAGLVKCAGDSQESPVLQSYYYSDEVCGAGLGAVIGGVVGAVGGILLGCLAAAAIGCATVILCIFALLAALLVAAAVVLIGALAGGQIGKAAAGDTVPSDPASGQPIVVGHYVTLTGNLVVLGDTDNAVVAWWVQSTTLHGGPSTNGEGPGGGAPYPFTDPDTNLQPDACPSPPVE
jgi:hypothetical protein